MPLEPIIYKRGKNCKPFLKFFGRYRLRGCLGLLLSGLERDGFRKKTRTEPYGETQAHFLTERFCGIPQNRSPRVSSRCFRFSEKPSARRRHRGQGLSPRKRREDIFPRCLHDLLLCEDSFFKQLYDHAVRKFKHPSLVSNPSNGLVQTCCQTEFLPVSAHFLIRCQIRRFPLSPESGNAVNCCRPFHSAVPPCEPLSLWGFFAVT